MTCNINQVLNLIKSGGNPQGLLMNIVSSQAGNNPMMNNVLGMMQSGNSSGIEKVARNLCKEKGINPDEMISNIKSQYGFK